MDEHDGNASQTRAIANQVADAAVLRFFEAYPIKPEHHVPPPLKWAGVFTILLGGAAVVGYFNWLTATVNEMQLTLVRMEERQESSAEENRRRIEVLEAHQRRDEE